MCWVGVQMQWPSLNFSKCVSSVQPPPSSSLDVPRGRGRLCIFESLPVPAAGRLSTGACWITSDELDWGLKRNSFTSHKAMILQHPTHWGYRSNISVHRWGPTPRKLQKTPCKDISPRDRFYYFLRVCVPPLHLSGQAWPGCGLHRVLTMLSWACSATLWISVSLSVRRAN